MTDQITVSLSLPPKALHPNARPHHHAKHRAVKVYRNSVALVVASSMRANGLGEPRWVNARAELRYVFKDRRKRDRDNLKGWFKAGYDALQDAGLILDDNTLERPEPTVEIVSGTLAPFVILTVTRLA